MQNTDKRIKRMLDGLIEHPPVAYYHVLLKISEQVHASRLF